MGSFSLDETLAMAPIFDRYLFRFLSGQETTLEQANNSIFEWTDITPGITPGMHETLVTNWRAVSALHWRITSESPVHSVSLWESLVVLVYAACMLARKKDLGIISAHDAWADVGMIPGNYHSVQRFGELNRFLLIVLIIEFTTRGALDDLTFPDVVKMVINQMEATGDSEADESDNDGPEGVIENISTLVDGTTELKFILDMGDDRFTIKRPIPASVSLEANIPWLENDVFVSAMRLTDDNSSITNAGLYLKEVQETVAKLFPRETGWEWARNSVLVNEALRRHY